MSWYLPDHLSAHEELLPTETPEPLIVPTPRNLQFLTRSHFLNQRYGPFTEERGPDGKLVMPEDRPLRDVEGEPSCHRQPPTRVRFPMKRMQLVEMGRRVGNVLEYVGRVQHEETRRLERAQRLGIPEGNAPRKLPPLDEDARPRSRKRPDGSEEDAPMDEVYESSKGPSSSVLLDELTRDLIAFQEAFQTGEFEELAFAQPPVRPVRPDPEPEPVPDFETQAEMEAEPAPEPAGVEQQPEPTVDEGQVAAAVATQPPLAQDDVTPAPALAVDPAAGRISPQQGQKASLETSKEANEGGSDRIEPGTLPQVNGQVAAEV